MNKIGKNKTTTTIIALFLALTIAATAVISVQTSKAQTAASPLPTHPYLAISPNPAGINQEVTLSMWLGEINPAALVSGGSRWENFTVLISEPDGTSQTLGPFRADDASFAFIIYVPDQIGEYTLEFSFPGQHVTGTSWLGVPVDQYFGASSFTATLVVQEQPATSTPQALLPTAYWTRPINSQNSDWYTISGNWLTIKPLDDDTYTSNVAPYTTAPNSAHILWTKPIIYGGLIGGEFGGGATSHYYEGKSYQAMWTPPIIINGVLYYNSAIAPYQGFYAVDLRTGQTLWFSNATSVWNGIGVSQSITLGQIYNYLSPNQEGASPYLWNMIGDPWRMYDANTGNLILSIANPRSGTNVEGPNGEILSYVYGNGWLAMWNSSRCIMESRPTYGFPSDAFNNEWTWRPQNNVSINWIAGVQWNVSVTTFPGLAIQAINSGVIFTAPNLFIGIGSPPIPTNMIAGYSSTTGQLLWNRTLTLPSGPATAYTYAYGPMADGVFTSYDALSMEWYGFSARTGNELWGPTEADTNPWGSQPRASSSQIAYGILYGAACDGIRAFNITTGQLLWTFSGLNSGTDFPGFSNYPFVGSAITIADGKIYVTTGLTHGAPMFRGAQLYCVNATSGTLLWSISDFNAGGALPISDGILTTFNGYDNQIYAYGKGPTKTTVTAPDPIIVLGSQVLLTGTVTDISVGAKQDQVAANYPNGLPAVSDDSMSQFMEAVYMQQAYPEDVEGVEVVITTLDPNGNTYEIGRTTSDMSGTFGIAVDPPVPGLYKIIATFKGSESYYGSSAVTYLNVEEAPSPSMSIEPELTTPAQTGSTSTELQPTETAEAVLITTEVAIIAAVSVAVVIGIVAYWALRKRK